MRKHFLDLEMNILSRIDHGDNRQMLKFDQMIVHLNQGNSHSLPITFSLENCL